MINLVIEDYIASLKEKDELDILLPTLLKLKGYNIKNMPRTGERQYGVDLLAEKDEELYLYVIKQGDLTRSAWNTQDNSVRQSIDEILDVYLHTMIDEKFIDRKKNIVFVTNGYIRDAVRPNWEGYKRTNETEFIKFDAILLDELVIMVQEFGFNETLFSKSMHSNLRKCLYYLDESDYKTNYFKKIVEEYIEVLSDTIGENKKNKTYHSMWMFINLVNSYVFDKKRYRVGVEFSEIILLRIWKHLKDVHAFENNFDTEWLYKFIENYNKCNVEFVGNISDFAKSSQGIPSHNSFEHRMLCFDILGILCNYGLFLSEHEKLMEDNEYTSLDISNLIINLLNNNYGFYYPMYDNDGIEISLLFYLLQRVNREEDLEILIDIYTSYILTMIKNGKYPLLNRQYSLALDINFGDVDYTPRYVASFLWGIIKEWVLLTQQYKLNEFINENEILKSIDIQNWNCSSADEDGLYNENTTPDYGYSTIYNELDDQALVKYFNNDKVLEDFEDFSFIKYSFPTIGLIISRMHRVPVIPSYWRKEFKKVLAE